MQVTLFFLRKLSAILILLLLLMSQVGYLLINTYQRGLVKSEMRSQIKAHTDESEFTKIILEDHAGDIVWREEGREFYLNGILYDVAKIKKQNNKTYLYCLDDKKEHELLVTMIKAVKSGNDNTATGKGNSPTIKFQISDYIIQNQADISFSTLISPAMYYDKAVATCSLFQNVNVPPPRA